MKSNNFKTGLSATQRNRQKLTRRIVAVTFLISLAAGFIILLSLSNRKTARAAVAGDYRSANSGNWNSAATWEIFNGTAWIAASTSPGSANGTISIQAGHNVNVTANVSADQIIIDPNGILNLNSGTLTLINGAGNDLTVNGTLTVGSGMSIAANAVIQVNSIAICNAGGNMSFTAGSTISVNTGATFSKNGGTITTSTGVWTVNSGATFKLNDQSALPLATWKSGSTCEVCGVTNSLPSNLNQTYSDFKWNCINQTSTLNFSGAFQTVQKDFTVISTGTGSIQLDFQGNNAVLNIGHNFNMQGGILYGCTNGSTTVNVGNDYIQTGGTFAFDKQGGTAYGNTSTILNVNHDLSLSGGNLDLSQCSANNPAKGIGMINLKGNMNLSSMGSLTETSAQSRGQVYFTGTTVQYFTNNNNIARFIDFIVNPSAILRMDNQVINGQGDFTLLNGGGLMIGHMNGITKTSATGNIQVTGTRTYNIGSDYTYNGLVGQNTGDGLPSQVRNLTFDNINNITLTLSTSVSATLSFLNGKCFAQTDTLTLGINTSTLGTLNRVTGHVIGYFRRWIASSTTTNTLFPIGTISYYNPAYFSFTSAPTAGSIVSRFVPSNPGTLGLPIMDAGLLCYTMGYGYWAFGGMNGFSGGMYTVQAVAEGFPGITDYTRVHLLRRVGTGSPWTANGIHAAGTGSNSAAEANRIKMTLLGDYGISSDDMNPLPVELISFDAKANSEYVELTWSTASEVNNDFFTVERSTDGIHFAKILTKKAVGNSSVTNNYEAHDLSPANGTSYYRLRQTDFDGKNTVSNIVSVKFDKAGKKTNLQIVSVSQFTNSFQMTYRCQPNSELQFILINSVGEVIDRAKLNTNENVNTYDYTDSHGLATGVYFIQISGSGEKILQKIVKEI